MGQEITAKVTITINYTPGGPPGDPRMSGGLGGAFPGGEAGPHWAGSPSPRSPAGLTLRSGRGLHRRHQPGGKGNQSSPESSAPLFAKLQSA